MVNEFPNAVGVLAYMQYKMQLPTSPFDVCITADRPRQSDEEGECVLMRWAAHIFGCAVVYGNDVFTWGASDTDVILMKSPKRYPAVQRRKQEYQRAV